MEEHLDEMALAGGESRSNLAAGILATTEYDRHLVAELYPRYLRRSVDPTGSQTYVNLLQAGARDEQIIADIVGSGEYF